MTPTRVLFVCLGNICRSPTAEGIFKYKISQLGLSEKYEHDSAGTSAFHAGETPDERSSAKASEKGVDLSFIRSRQFITEDYCAYDYIFAMDAQNYADIKSDYPSNAISKVELMLMYTDQVEDKNVPDPYWSKDDGFELVFNLLEESIGKFIASHEAQP